METNREVARREPPAADLAAYQRRDVGAMTYCSHNDIKKERAAANSTSPISKLCKVPFAGLLPNGSAHSYSYQCFESFDRNRLFSILFAGAKVGNILESNNTYYNEM